MRVPFRRVRSVAQRSRASSPDWNSALKSSVGHHADIGSITPGSMPPMSRTIHEEGVLSTGLKLMDLIKNMSSKPLNYKKMGENITVSNCRTDSPLRGGEYGALFIQILPLTDFLYTKTIICNSYLSFDAIV